MEVKPINIDGLSQIEIEQKFNGNEAKEMLRIDYDIFYSNCDEIDIKIMEDILATKDQDLVNDMFLYILSIIGNQDIGIPNRNNNRYTRDINAHNIISAIAKFPLLQKRYKTMAQCCNKAMEIVGEFDGILWDLHKVSKKIDGQWTTITYANVGVHWNEDSNLRAQYLRFRLPMLEVPHDWKVGFQGGYHLNKSNVTTNRGDNNQPQEVLDVLNKLQRQSFVMINHINPDEEHKLVYSKMANKFPLEKAVDVAQATCQTIRETYATMKGKKFYFEWRYDFRGRLYNTGYDLTLQGSKYKKGSITHKFN